MSDGSKKKMTIGKGLAASLLDSFKDLDPAKGKEFIEELTKLAEKMDPALAEERKRELAAMQEEISKYENLLAGETPERRSLLDPSPLDDSFTALLKKLMRGECTRAESLFIGELLMDAHEVMAKLRQMRPGDNKAVICIGEGRYAGIQLPPELGLKVMSIPMGKDGKPSLDDAVRAIMAQKAEEEFAAEDEEGCKNPLHNHPKSKRPTLH